MHYGVSCVGGSWRVSARAAQRRIPRPGTAPATSLRGVQGYADSRGIRAPLLEGTRVRHFSRSTGGKRSADRVGANVNRRPLTSIHGRRRGTRPARVATTPSPVYAYALIARTAFNPRQTPSASAAMCSRIPLREVGRVQELRYRRPPSRGLGDDDPERGRAHGSGGGKSPAQSDCRRSPEPRDAAARASVRSLQWLEMKSIPFGWPSWWRRSRWASISGSDSRWSMCCVSA